jgi:S-formylglutathione hydrolase FrmB
VSWISEVLTGKSVDLFVPEGTASPTGVVLFLHGIDEVTLRDNPAFIEQLQRHRLACLCPHGGQCMWTDQIYAPFDEKQSPLDFLHAHVPDFCRERWQIESPKIGLCGIEIGGQGALQLAYRHARQFPVVAAISPKIDFESWHGHGTSLDEIFPTREAARQATATLHIHPLDWPKHQLLLCDPADLYSRDGVHTLASKLVSTGIPFERDFETTHGGYGWTYANAVAARAIEFIAASLG